MDPFGQPTILYKLTDCVHVQQITKLLIADLVIDLLAPASDLCVPNENVTYVM